MAGFDPKAYADAVDAQGKGGFDPAAYADAVEGAPAYRSTDDRPTAEAEAFAGHAADNVPFMKQLAAIVGAAKMKAAGSPVGLGENYDQLLLAEQRQLARSKEEHPVLSRLGAASGFAGTAAALPGSGWKGLTGLGALLGLADSTANPENTAGDVAKQTAASAVLAPVVGKVAEMAAPRLGALLGRGGEKVRDLAGWLKVNSIHPTPTLGEAMEDIPGGVPAVGRELMKRGIGGLTKHGTAEQIAAAFDSEAGKASALAKAYDAAGGSPVDLSDAIAKASDRAEKLMREPATREAGQKLQALVSEYADMYGHGDAASAGAQDALNTKRGLAAIGYGAKQEFKLNKNPVVGDYGAGIRQLERGVDGALDDALGPQFGEANDVIRRLGGAKQAAERAAARTAGNHAIGLLPYLAGLSGAVGGHMTGHAGPEAAAYGLGALLASKYGAQTGARVLYSPVGGGLVQFGRGLQSSGPFAGRLAAERAPSLANLLQALRSSPDSTK